MPDSDEFDSVEEQPSKSARKREVTALQDLGEALCELSPRELAGIPIDNPDLREAVEQSGQITSNSARRRHMQFIGKLMRHIDAEPIRAAMDALHREKTADSSRLHELEALRDDLVSRGDVGVSDLLQRWPEADRQHLRQLLRQIARESSTGKPPASSRKLFRYLRDLQSGIV